MKPNYSLIIPTTGNIEKLKTLLRSLETLRSIEQSEVLLILNPPSNKVDCMKTLFSGLNLKVLTSQPGVNRARNKGLLASKGKLIFFLDDDCWISDPDFLLKQEEAHKKNPWAFAIGGFYHNHSLSTLAKEYSKIQSHWLLNNKVSAAGECQTLLGGHFSIKNSANLPLFDESIVYGGAETEFFFRLRKQGYRYLLTNVSVNHSPQLTLISFMKKAYLQGKTHKRLVNEGIFQESSWLDTSDKTAIQSLYYLVFHRKWFQLFLGPLKTAKLYIKCLHHDIWFYLSNRNRF